MAQPRDLSPSPSASPSLTWEERDVPAGGRRLHLRLAHGAAPAGRPLLLVHGLGASGAVWQALARRLVAGGAGAPGWAPIAPDLPGHGESEPPAGGAAGYSPEALAGALVGALDALGVAQAPVVGHSLGALVALALVVHAPHRVPAAVLLDPPLDAGRRNPEVAEVYRLRDGPPGALEAYLTASTGSPLAARALAPIFRRADEAVYRTYLDAPPGAPWAWAEAPHVAAPVLVVQADPAAGGVLGDEAAEGFVARLPRGQLLRLPGARHAVHASHPGEVARAILEFLSVTDAQNGMA
ncbi:MAG TPA: alpha/beta fold hydrolase [Chloroflexota bacterium]|nr:alpha/beta fold hydrolase [Chloroflexota bacterium]